MSKRNIVVIGGGFAGITLVKKLERKLPPEWQIILVSEENYIVYTPLLPEVVGASLQPGHTVAPLRKMFRHATYYRARVNRIDLERACIHVQSNRSHEIPYEHLVLGFGKVPNLSMIEGLEKHALPLKTLGDALYIRNRMIVSLEQAELESDRELCERLTTYIVIGGGTSGVEVAGAIADFLNTARKFYDCTSRITPKVVLLENGDRLLPEFPSSLGEAALKHMSRSGIEVHLNSAARRITERGVQVDDDNWIDGANVICTIGTKPRELLHNLDLPQKAGLIETEDDMSVKGQEKVWAVGDCAAVTNADDSSLCPPTAQFAVRQGRQLADNLARALRNEPTRAFRFHSPGQLATIGHRRAVALLFGIRLSGFPAWLLWRGVYLFMLPTLLRKLEVFSQWNLELLFPRDMTQLHMARTESSESRNKNDKQQDHY